MKLQILIFNIVFYGVTLFLYSLTKQDPSSSLGIGFIGISFWILSSILLTFLLLFKGIRPKTVIDKIGIVTATPIPLFALLWIVRSFGDSWSSTSYAVVNKHLYRIDKFNDNHTGNLKRIEYYKSVDTISLTDRMNDNGTWVKDSTWVYFSKSGDTSKTLKYSNNRPID
jgi:hypothetical protein